MVFWPKLYSISKKHPEFPKKLIFILEKGTFCFEKLFPARTRLEWRSALFFGPKISVLGQRIQFLPYDPKFGQRPVGSTVRYEMMKMCIGSVKDTLRRWQLVLDDTLSAEGIYAFINCTKWRSVQVLPMPYSLTHSLQGPYLGNVWTIKVVLEFWFGHWKCHFCGPKTVTFAKSAHLWDQKNGTSSGQIKFLRPLL